MVNRAPWYKQLKSIIPTNIPNQKARPRIKKMSINYKSQKKDFAFFHCSPPQKKKDKSQKKDFAFFHCFPPKKDKSQEKNLHYFLFFLQKKAKSQKKNLHYFSFFS